MNFFKIWNRCSSARVIASALGTVVQFLYLVQRPEAAGGAVEVTPVWSLAGSALRTVGKAGILSVHCSARASCYEAVRPIPTFPCVKHHVQSVLR